VRPVICRLAFLLAAAISIPALPASAQTRSDALALARSRAQHLRHGINTSNWFSQNPGHYSAQDTNSETTPADIALIARLGFDNVRLSIDPDPLLQYPLGPDGLNVDFLARLDRAVDEILSHGMAVQIDLHPQDDYKQRLRSDPYAVDRFIMLWRKLAAHYANRDPDRVFFEILNEPEVADPYRWAGIQARAAAAIRQAAPHNTLIATGANYSNLQDLLALHPLHDPNVIYTFHFYSPHAFTHQGANWGLPWWRYEHNIPYPPTASTMQPLLQEVPDLADRFDLENYWLDHWDAAHIRALIDEAATWGRINNVPVLCNEFGAYRQFSDPDDRNRWIHDVRTALEADGIGWDMWDFHGSFGVATVQNGKSIPDPATVSALGLSPQ
jgi:endoglucanase